MWKYCYENQCTPNQGKVLPKVNCFICSTMPFTASNDDYEAKIQNLMAANKQLNDQIKKMAGEIDRIQKK